MFEDELSDWFQSGIAVKEPAGAANTTVISQNGSNIGKLEPQPPTTNQQVNEGKPLEYSAADVHM